ncbi:MAG: hypothetical protein HC910_22475 [Spirulinaceae cyanobacterium SM2_1_0]|nr:hypothetical protein [Spirulinaceae cyanobacterium SM2_1_0]
MRQTLSAIALSVAATLAAVAAHAQAIEPALIDYHASGPWSSVEYSEFDGLYVNDRHDGIGGERDYIVTQWSWAGIRATFRDYRIVGHTVVPRVYYRTQRYYNHHTRRWIHRRVPEVVYERIPEWSYTDRTPTEIQFAINGEQYVYTEGEVVPVLAAALVSAPAGNMRVRVKFDDNSAQQFDIGASTVRAWQRVFGEPLTPAALSELQRQEQQAREAAREPNLLAWPESRR